MALIIAIFEPLSRFFRGEIPSAQMACKPLNHAVISTLTAWALMIYKHFPLGLAT